METSLEQRPCRTQ